MHGRRRLRVGLVALCLSPSCRGVEPAPAPIQANAGAAGPAPVESDRDLPRGGTRLRAVLARAADGAEELVHFRDTRLGVACRFERAGAAEWRCLPIASEVADVREILFADATCTRPVAALARPFDRPASCGDPGWAREAGPPEGCGPGRYRRVLARSPNTALYRMVPGACVRAPTAPEGLGTFILDPQDPEPFVTAAPADGPVRDGIAPVSLAASDGSRVPLALRDIAGGFTCAVEDLSDGARCLPADRAFLLGAFADAVCATPAAMALTCLDGDRPPPAFAFEGLGTIQRVFRAGARLAAHYERSGTDCRRAADESVAHFSIADEVPRSAFVVGRRGQEARPTGLEQTVERAGGWSRVLPGSLRDPRRGRCLIDVAADGVTRCLPFGTVDSTQIHFADAGCTIPAVPNQDAALSVRFADACPARHGAYARGERHDGRVYGLRAGVCALVAESPPNASARVVYQTYREIPPSELVALPLTER